MLNNTQYFNGKKFNPVGQSQYYREVGNFKNLMHRYVWEYYNGKIPEGCEIHHKDFDRSNNDIANLECLTVSEHKKLHAELLTNTKREWYRQNLENNARPKAIEWHKSEEGSKWHSEHIIKQREQGKFKKALVCVNCGKEYVGEKRGANNYCSNACKSAYRRKTGADLVPAVCVQCGQYFKTSKLRPALTCSRSCANRYRAKLHRGN